MPKKTDRGTSSLLRENFASDFAFGGSAHQDVQEAARKARGDAERIFGKYDAALRSEVGRALATQSQSVSSGRSKR